MGYLDALTYYHFGTARDGRKLYFPAGRLGTGYVIGSEQDFQRLQHQIKTGTVAALVLIGISSQVSYLAGNVVGALLVVLYMIWSWYRSSSMQPSEERPERLSVTERLASQARAHSERSLWSMEISSLAFVLAGVFLFFADPGKRPIAVATLVLFGCGAALFAFQLVLRYRERPTRT